jgi:2-haloacid dehalogenase
VSRDATGRRRIGAVVFDLGGVFFDWDPRHLYQQLIPDARDREWFLSEVCSPRWHAEQDLGRGIRESCDELAAQYPAYADLIAAWADRNEEMIAGVFEETVDLLHELREASVRCYALSNMESEAFALRRSNYSFMSDFDGFVISSHEGAAKPDPVIFTRLIARFGLAPDRTLFVDDQAPNIDVARRLGFDVCLFTTPKELRRSLVERRLLTTK